MCFGHCSSEYMGVLAQWNQNEDVRAMWFADRLAIRSIRQYKIHDSASPHACEISLSRTSRKFVQPAPCEHPIQCVTGVLQSVSDVVCFRCDEEALPTHTTNTNTTNRLSNISVTDLIDRTSAAKQLRIDTRIDMPLWRLAARALLRSQPRVPIQGPALLCAPSPTSASPSLRGGKRRR